MLGCMPGAVVSVPTAVLIFLKLHRRTLLQDFCRTLLLSVSYCSEVVYASCDCWSSVYALNQLMDKHHLHSLCVP